MLNNRRSCRPYIKEIINQRTSCRLVTDIAPKFIGKGIEAVGELNITNLQKAKMLSFQKVSHLGTDVIIDSLFV